MPLLCLTSNNIIIVTITGGKSSFRSANVLAGDLQKLTSDLKELEEKRNSTVSDIKQIEKGIQDLEADVKKQVQCTVHTCTHNYECVILKTESNLLFSLSPYLSLIYVHQNEEAYKLLFGIRYRTEERIDESVRYE